MSIHNTYHEIQFNKLKAQCFDDATGVFKHDIGDYVTSDVCSDATTVSSSSLLLSRSVDTEEGVVVNVQLRVHVISQPCFCEENEKTVVFLQHISDVRDGGRCGSLQALYIQLGYAV